jgi:hypothetical protein
MSPDEDDLLLDRLRRVAAEADAVPENVLAAARAALATRDPDLELARLVADSAEAGFEPVRSGPVAARLLAFDGGGVRVDLDVEVAGGRTVLIGHLTGADACVLERGDGGRQLVPLDELGRFRVGGVRPGPLRLRCRGPAGRTVTTSWVTV